MKGIASKFNKTSKYIQKKAAPRSGKELEPKGVIDIANDFLNNSVINKFAMESQRSEREGEEESKDLGSGLKGMELLKGGLPRSRQANANLLGKPAEIRTADSANEVFKYQLASYNE